MTSFTQLYAKFRSLLQESWQTAEVAAHFGPTATLDSMFQYLWSRPETLQALMPPAGNARISVKGATEAEKFRNEGNRLYRERKLEQALVAYNYSILAAPHPVELEGDAPSVIHTDAALLPQGHEGLALGYANRSAVLYEMGQFEGSLSDAERALSFGYPTTRRHRLQERRSKCLQALGRTQEARDVIDETLAVLETLSLDPKEMATARNSLTKLRAKGESGGGASSVKAPQQFERLMYTGPGQPPAVSCPRTDLPCLSQALRIQYTPIRGRHLVADRDIQPGKAIHVSVHVR